MLWKPGIYSVSSVFHQGSPVFSKYDTPGHVASLNYSNDPSVEASQEVELVKVAEVILLASRYVVPGELMR